MAACRPRKQMAAGHYLPFFLLVFLLFTRLFLCENEKNPERGSRVETRKFRNQNIKIALPLMSNRFSEIETLFLLLFWRNRWSRSDDSAANGFFFFCSYERKEMTTPLFGVYVENEAKWSSGWTDSIILSICKIIWVASCSVRLKSSLTQHTTSSPPTVSLSTVNLSSI